MLSFKRCARIDTRTSRCLVIVLKKTHKTQKGRKYLIIPEENAKQHQWAVAVIVGERCFFVARCLRDHNWFLIALGISNNRPFVEAHDSATGYLEADGIIKKIVYDWTKTQVGGLGQQLGCGQFRWLVFFERGAPQVYTRDLSSTWFLAHATHRNYAALGDFIPYIWSYVK